MKKWILIAALALVAACDPQAEQGAAPETAEPAIGVVAFREAQIDQQGDTIRVTREPGRTSGLTLRPPESPPHLATIRIDGAHRISALQGTWRRLRTDANYQLMVGGEAVTEIRILPRSDEPITVRIEEIAPCGGAVTCSPLPDEEPETLP